MHSVQRIHKKRQRHPLHLARAGCGCTKALRGKLLLSIFLSGLLIAIPQARGTSRRSLPSAIPLLCSVSNILRVKVLHEA